VKFTDSGQIVFRVGMHHEHMRFEVQDTGPGFGISVSYGGLRESYHTDVDGTSIDTLEKVAARLGLNVE
jgi:hypothetical protein